MLFKKSMKKIFWLGIILITAAAAGTLLLCSTYLLPQERIDDHLRESLEILQEEGEYHQVIDGYKSTQLDNFTDSVMLLHAGYKGNEGILEKALADYKVVNGNGEMIASLVSYVTEDTKTFQKENYAWYWHGYLVVLKPLLVFFDYNEIRMLNYFLQMVLLFYLLYKLHQYKLNSVGIALFGAMLLIQINTISMSLQYSSVFYITLSNMLLALYLWRHGKLNYDMVMLEFFITGILISFFDLLTYPLIACGLPLILVCYIRQTNEESFSGIWKSMLTATLGFGIGYVGMWGLKWVITDAVLDLRVIHNALSHVVMRVSSSGLDQADINRVDAIVRNLRVFNTTPINLMIGGGITLLLGKIIYYGMKQKEHLKLLKRIAPYLILSMYPICWYYVLANHSQIHYFFTYRKLAVSLMAIILLVADSSCIFVKVQDRKNVRVEIEA